VTGRRGRRCKQLLDNFKEKRGYGKLKEEALGRTVWGTCSSEAVELSYGMSDCYRCTLVAKVSACGLDDPRSPRGCGWNFSSFHVDTDPGAQWGRLQDELSDRVLNLTTLVCVEIKKVESGVLHWLERTL
jgi:hypothetical protein